MKTFTLTPLQSYRIQEALRHSQAVLRELKVKPLAGKKLLDMKTLEEAVSNLEVFNISCDHASR